MLLDYVFKGHSTSWRDTIAEREMPVPTMCIGKDDDSGSCRHWHFARAVRAIFHLSQEALTLTQSKVNSVETAQMLREYTAVPGANGKTKVARCLAQIRLHSPSLGRIQRTRAPRSLNVMQSIEPVRAKPPNPTLHRTRIFAEPLCDLGARSTSSH